VGDESIEADTGSGGDGPRASAGRWRLGLRRWFRPSLVRLLTYLDGGATSATLTERCGAAEDRLQANDRHTMILYRKADGMASHLEGLSRDHLDLNAQFLARVNQLTSHAETISGLGRRQDELDARVQTVSALHWDYLAITRRLAVLEDLLAERRDDSIGPARPATPPENQPSIPFPGLDAAARSRVC